MHIVIRILNIVGTMSKTWWSLFFRSRFSAFVGCWRLCVSWKIVGTTRLCRAYSPSHCKFLPGMLPITHIPYGKHWSSSFTSRTCFDIHCGSCLMLTIINYSSFFLICTCFSQMSHNIFVSSNRTNLGVFVIWSQINCMSYVRLLAQSLHGTFYPSYSVI